MSAQASRLAVILFLCSGSAALAQPAPSLGAADSFVILARTGVADLDPGPTTVTGSVGCPAGIADSIAPNPGGKFVKDAIVQRALRDSTALYDGLAGRSCTDPLTEFPGTLLPNRVYCFAANAELTKTLTFAGTRDDSWYIKIAGCLTLDRDAAMLLQGDALSSHIFWAVGDCVTLGVNSGVAGNLIARNDITFGRGVTLAGRAISLQGAVTLDGDAINLCGKLIALAPPALPAGTLGCPYPTPTIVPSGGDPDYAIEVVGDDDGVLAGTPKSTGTFDFDVRARDARGAVGIRHYEVTIYPSAVPRPSLPDAKVCDPYSGDLQPSGGSGQFVFDVTGLPPDLIPQNHGIVGTPKVAGDFPIDVKITDTASGCVVSAKYALHVGCDVSISASLPEGKVCQSYHGCVTASCPGSFVATIVDGTLPPGLVISPTGCIDGTPATAGTYSFTVQVQHISGCLVRGPFTITVKSEDPPPLIVIEGTVCMSLNVPIACTIVDPLPAGLEFKNHALQGTPKIKTDQFVTARCADCPQEQPYEIRIGCPQTILSDNLPHVLPFYKPPVDLVICRQDIKECLPCKVDQTTLPPGLNMVGDQLMGLPDTLGKYCIKVTAVDALGSCPLNEEYCIEIVDPPLCEPSITIVPPPKTFFGTVGVPLPPLAFSATGGTAPYAYDVVVPALPPGVFLSLAGVLKGTPAIPGRFNFSVRATDATGTPGCPHVYTLEIGN
jgi:hypothetical protein